jgi:D-alanyl-D-alanine carboxypeptidase (penicillin-binding protein 5/6)
MLLIIGAVAFNYIRPLPDANASIASALSTNNSSDSVNLKWPVQGSAAIGAQGFGVLATHGAQAQRPTASIAKIITVLAILEKHPLKLHEQGPTLTMTQQDVDLFNKYYQEGGSYVKVELGEKITEYQVLQAILLPSANNMADGLAIWSFGSMQKYTTYANDMLKRLGLNDTVAATDASGFSPDTKSTPSDLVRLGDLALRNPVIAEIVAQPNATIPVHGMIYSANSRLGYNNIIGIKTGLTDQAGGCFLFAAKYQTAHDTSVTIVGIITGEPTLKAAMDGASPLLDSAKPYFSVKTPVKAGEVFATLQTPWLATSQVVAKEDITMLSWGGKPLKPSLKLADINRSLPGGAQVGTAVIASGDHTATTPLVLEKSISGPTWQWRLKRF